jgi:ABC-type sugar transport system ATPase subunit
MAQLLLDSTNLTEANATRLEQALEQLEIRLADWAKADATYDALLQETFLTTNDNPAAASLSVLSQQVVQLTRRCEAATG